MVSFATRASNILDIILTTYGSLFSIVAPDLPLGTSDHSSVRFELSLPANCVLGPSMSSQSPPSVTKIQMV